MLHELSFDIQERRASRKDAFLLIVEYITLSQRCVNTRDIALTLHPTNASLWHVSIIFFSRATPLNLVLIRLANSNSV